MDLKQEFKRLLSVLEVARGIRIDTERASKMFDLWSKNPPQDYHLPIIEQWLATGDWQGRMNVFLSDFQIQKADEVNQEALAIQRRSIEYDWKIRLENALRHKETQAIGEKVETPKDVEFQKLQSEIKDKEFIISDLQSKLITTTKRLETLQNDYEVLEKINKVNEINCLNYEKFIIEQGYEFESTKDIDYAIEKLKSQSN